METKKLTKEQIAALKQPLPAEAVNPHPTKNYLSSIKAIYVVERLNDVFGLGGWFCTNEIVTVDGKMVVAKSTFNAPEYGIVIPDIFGGNDNPDLGDAHKGACTDALTKIGSYLYIGMDVYKGIRDVPAKRQAPEKKDESNKKEWLDEDHASWVAASEAVKSGKYSLDQIKAKYNVSKRVEALLTAAI